MNCLGLYCLLIMYRDMVAIGQEIARAKYKKVASTFRVLQNANNVIIFMLLESLRRGYA